MSVEHGEPDYTQRVLATIRPSGLVGGRLLFIEDFESLVLHSAAGAGTSGQTTNPGEVYAGDRSGYLVAAISNTAVQVFPFAIPVLGKLAAEVICRPRDDNTQIISLYLPIIAKGRYYYPTVRVYYDGTNVLLQVYTDALTWETIETIGKGPISTGWHVLYMSFDLSTAKYQLVQFDSHKINIHTKAMRNEVSLLPEHTEAWFYTTASASGESTVYYDNFIISSEDD
jgi:hypothetical protein